MTLTITVENASDSEKATAELLSFLFEQHDLSKWQFTDTVHIADNVIPHSHPILTLNTNQVDDADMLLSSYLHEQLHWYADANKDNLFSAMDELVELYPDVPVGLPEGGGDEAADTYLHLAICYLEYISLIEVIGERRALEVMQYLCEDHYTWVYATVLDETDKIGAVIHRHGLA